MYCKKEKKLLQNDVMVFSLPFSLFSHPVLQYTSSMRAKYLATSHPDQSRPSESQNGLEPNMRPDLISRSAPNSRPNSAIHRPHSAIH